MYFPTLWPARLNAALDFLYEIVGVSFNSIGLYRFGGIGMWKTDRRWWLVFCLLQIMFGIRYISLGLYDRAGLSGVFAIASASCYFVNAPLTLGARAWSAWAKERWGVARP